jgi:glycosyltransferase involved in cell wall biosynthesis
MIDQPLVSVIVPAYNAQAYIHRALESAQSQTYANLEIIVVDDGSTDNTRSIVQEMAQQDSRIKLLQQANAGVAAARNLAIEYSTGQYVAPLDADDLWFPEKIEKQVRRMEEGGPAVGLVYTSSVHIDENTEAVVGADPLWCVEGRVFQAMIYTNFTGNASVPLIRRSYLQEVGCYDPQLRAQGGQGCEDWDVLLRIAERYEFRAVPEYLVRYRAVTGSMSRNSAAMGKSYELVMGRIRKRHPEVPNEVFRWSKSYFSLYLAGGSYGANPGQTLYWSLRALRYDPATILIPWFRKVFFRSLIWCALNPVNSLRKHQSTRQQWKKLKEQVMRRFRFNSEVEHSVAEFEEKYRDKEIPWDSENIYDRICIRRFQRVIKNG